MTDQPRIAAVVVTFHPSARILRQLVDALEVQVHGTVIVDNTPGGAALSDLSERRIALIQNAGNAGLAAAQNQGIRWAQMRGFTHVLMLDQDSFPEPGCVERLYDASRKLAAKGQIVGAVGPRVLDRRTGRDYSFKRFTFAGIQHDHCLADEVIHADFVIASGTLTAMEVFQTVGLMDEGFFIDRIDIDWCFRAAAAGRPVYGVCAARLLHEPGEQSRRIWIGRRAHAALHSPERNYYMIRNSLVLYRKAYAPLRWILNDAAWLLGVVLVSCVVAPGRWRRLRLVVQAVRDGLRRIQGPLL